MDRDHVLEAIRTIFKTSLSIDIPRNPDLRLRDLQLDSLQQLTLLVELENRFLLAFEEGDERDLETLSDLVTLVIQHLPSSGGSGDE